MGYISIGNTRETHTTNPIRNTILSQTSGNLRSCRDFYSGPKKHSIQLGKHCSGPCWEPTENPIRNLLEPLLWLMVPPCFYWASKLVRGTFWAGLQTLKSLAAAFDGFSTAQPSAAALEASRLLCHGASLLVPKAVSIGLRNCRVARFGQAFKPSKASQELSKASAPHKPVLGRP